MPQHSLQLIMLFLLTFTLQTVSANADFPGRPQYPDIAVVELKDMQKNFDNVVVIDVRSEYEFETLHVKGAINVPVASTGFEKNVRNIRNTSKKQIVFYCNGHTCMKSYKAARKAKLAAIDNCAAFDAGIFDWAKADPARTVLLGDPLQPGKLLGKDKFRNHQLDPKSFAKKVGTNVEVIDVRDRFQRAAVGLFPFQERWIPLDRTRTLEDAMREAKRRNKTLLIYDEVGKQVRWLQYRLEKMGVRDYYFMKGGANEYIKQI